MRITDASVLAFIAIVATVGAFLLMVFRIIPEIVFWLVIIPCTAVAYWVVPKMREKQDGKKK